MTLAHGADWLLPPVSFPLLSQEKPLSLYNMKCLLDVDAVKGIIHRPGRCKKKYQELLYEYSGAYRTHVELQIRECFIKRQ